MQSGKSPAEESQGLEFMLDFPAQEVKVEPALVEQPVELSAQDLDGDDELLSIFLEEAREVVDNGLQALQALADEPANLGEQTTLRRAFHTLKGSSRMVGLDEFGEAGWALSKCSTPGWPSKAMPEPMQQLARDALKAFGAWAQDLEQHRAENWSATPFRAAADAMRMHGERAEVALVPRRGAREELAEPLESVQSLAPAVDVQIEATQAVVSEEATADSLPELEWAAEIPALEFPEFVPDATEAADVPDRPAELELVAEQGPLTAMSLELPDEVPVVESAAPVAEPSVSADAVQELDFAAFEAAIRESEQASIATQTPAIAEARPELLKPDLPELVQTEAAEPATALQEADAAPLVEDDGYKNIDGLRISTPLYNVYLNEADEWSARLDGVLQQWMQQPKQEIPEEAIALAHSLAGSSGTVGFKALSELARLLEHALQHLLPQRYASETQICQSLEASDEIRRLLHQFAAGFLKTPLPTVEEALREILSTEVQALELPAAEEELLAPDSEWPDDVLAPLNDPKDLPLDFAAEAAQSQSLAQIQTEARAEPAAAEVASAGASSEAVQEIEPESKALADVAADQVLDAADPVALQAPYSLVPGGGSVDQEAELQRRIDEAIALAVHAADDEDDIDVLDQVDPDLFPIFEEEAVDLLPKLGAALRRWHGRPALEEARNEALRALHTLKGSARLAGAMRMGEWPTAWNRRWSV